MPGPRFATFRPTTLPLLVLLYHLLAGGGCLHHQAVAGDRETLLAIAISNEWSFPPHRLKSWSPTSSPNDHYCRWPGITCAAAGGGVVTELNLPNLKLAGTVPASVCALKNLSRLDLSYNNLTGPFPAAALNSCTKLRFLDLSNNHFSGGLPRGMDVLLPGIEHLNLSTNHFSGGFPAKIWSLPKLTTVMIQNNSFNGTLPSEISSSISRVEMGNNMFSGFFPTLATGLKVFHAENNRLGGEFPSDTSKLRNLTDLSVPGNRITGSIPASIRLLKKINTLDLSGNRISGVIPPGSIGQLPKLTTLDLSDNDLTGSIPSDISDQINKLNLSSNQLTGEVPVLLQIAAYDRSFLDNPGLCAKAGSGTNLPTCGGKRLSRGMIMLFAMLAGIIFVASIGIAWLCFRRRKEMQEVKGWKMLAENFSPSDVLSNLHDDNVIDRGGSGTVYRVSIATRGNRAGRIVAVKRICMSGPHREEEFEAEIKVLGSINHGNNIVELLGYSKEEKLIVLEFMENGSLHRWLHPRNHEGAAPAARLDWRSRLSIAIDVAKGLKHMHHDCVTAIVHRDVKSKNILLDNNFSAKIADFGLALFLTTAPGQPESSVFAFGAGTPGYMAPETLTRREVNEKVDVYGFGVVLLELITGKAPVDTDMGLVELASKAWLRYREGAQLDDGFVDEAIIRDPIYIKQIHCVLDVAMCCTMHKPHERPSMREVLRQLIRCQQIRGE